MSLGLCLELTVALKRTGFFVDPETNELIRSDQRRDVEGMPVIEQDDALESTWWGTPRAAWKLSDAETVVNVYGDIGGGLEWEGGWHWEGWFLGTEEEAAAFAEAHGVRILYCGLATESETR
jgi:hypothetical protein